MNYHMIRTDDMLNGEGLRVVIFLSGCLHHCEGCHNPETWNVSSGKEFTANEINAIMSELDKDYISGVTLSGGDPLHPQNLPEVCALVKLIKSKYPEKTIWIYTGYRWDEIMALLISGNRSPLTILEHCDVLCDGEFIQDLADVNYPWVGSKNQRIIDVQKSLELNQIVLWNE